MNKKKVIGILLVLMVAIGTWQFNAYRVRRATMAQNDPFASIEIPQRYDEATRAIINEKIETTKAQYASNPNVWETWIAIGNLRSLLDDYEGAIAAYRKSIELQSNNILGYRNIAEIYNQHIKDYEKAAEYYELALENKFDEVDIYNALALVYAKKLNQPEKAEKTYIVGLNRTGYDSSILLNLIAFYKDTGNTEKYLEAVRTLLIRHPNNEAYKNTYGPILEQNT